MNNKTSSLRNILFIDIETVGLSKSFEELNPRLKEQWEKKSEKLKYSEEELSLSPSELFSKKSGIFAEFGKVVVISLGMVHIIDQQPTIKVKSIYGHDEKTVLEKFKYLLETKFDKTLRLCAHNGKEFDFPYICRRMIINNIEIPDVLNIAGKKPWEVNHLDTMEMWKFGDRKSYSSLELLTSIFDIESSKSDIDGSQVHSCYYLNNELERISEYCMNDVIATIQVYLRMNFLPLIKDENIIKEYPKPVSTQGMIF